MTFVHKNQQIFILCLLHKVELALAGYVNSYTLTYFTALYYLVFVLLQFVPMEENENYASDLPIAETSQVSYHPLFFYFHIWEDYQTHNT